VAEKNRPSVSVIIKSLHVYRTMVLLQALTVADFRARFHPMKIHERKSNQSCATQQKIEDETTGDMIDDPLQSSLF
jgi:hypothetical protein